MQKMYRYYGTCACACDASLAATLADNAHQLSVGFSYPAQDILAKKEICPIKGVRLISKLLILTIGIKGAPNW